LNGSTGLVEFDAACETEGLTINGLTVDRFRTGEMLSVDEFNAIFAE
jgi:hypothetical protein